MTSPCVQPSSLKPVRKYSHGTEPDGEQSEIPDQKQFSNFYFKSFIYLRHYSFYGTLKTPFKSLYSSGTDVLGLKHFTMLDQDVKWFEARGV